MATMAKKLTPAQSEQLEDALTELSSLSGQLEKLCNQHEQLVVLRDRERSARLILGLRHKPLVTPSSNSANKAVDNDVEANPLLLEVITPYQEDSSTVLPSVRKQLSQLSGQILKLKTKQAQLQRLVVKYSTLEQVAQLRVQGVLK